MRSAVSVQWLPHAAGVRRLRFPPKLHDAFDLQSYSSACSSASARRIRTGSSFSFDEASLVLRCTWLLPLAGRWMMGRVHRRRRPTLTSAAQNTSKRNQAFSTHLPPLGPRCPLDEPLGTCLLPRFVCEWTIASSALCALFLPVLLICMSDGDLNGVFVCVSKVSSSSAPITLPIPPSLLSCIFA
jgi:hypothetical protein